MTEPPLQDEARRSRNRRSLVLIMGIAIVPITMAYLLVYFFPELIPKGTTNKGMLVSPPIAISKIQDGMVKLPDRKWVLVMTAGVDCDKTCRHALYLARQANIALGKNANRVSRLLLVSDDHVSKAFQTTLSQDYSHMLIQYVAPDSVYAALGHVSTSGSLDGYIFLADPGGFVMMAYSPDNTGKDILSDLKHLFGTTG